MTQKLFVLLLGVVLAAAASTPAAAANKEHQQLMADIRMLQEQSQTLQNLLGQLNETLRAVNTRLDQQAETTRKAFADQKLVIDNLTNDVRVIREKLDDNNVRVGSLTQEVDAMRQSLQQLSVRPAATPEPEFGAPAGSAPPATGTPPAAAPAGGALTASPKQMWDAAYADYTSGQYDLAILGFDAYVKSFPKADLADDAQVMICASYLNDKKDQKAVEACDVAIRTYPGGNAIPDAYYRKGLALANLKDVNGARAAWETVVQNFKDTDAARLARQRLDQIRRPD
jgi:TolA-binding protein